MTLAFDHLMNKTAESRKLNSLHCCNKHVEIKDNSLCLLHFVNVIKEKSVKHLTYKMVIIFFRIRPASLYRKEIIYDNFSVYVFTLYQFILVQVLCPLDQAAPLSMYIAVYITILKLL